MSLFFFQLLDNLYVVVFVNVGCSDVNMELIIKTDRVWELLVAL